MLPSRVRARSATFIRRGRNPAIAGLRGGFLLFLTQWRKVAIDR